MCSLGLVLRETSSSVVVVVVTSLETQVLLSAEKERTARNRTDMNDSELFSGMKFMCVPFQEWIFE